MSDTLYLCLDLRPRVGVMLKGIDLDMPLPALLRHEVANGRHFERNWQCFEDLEVAKAHVAENPSLVLIPIAAEVIPLAQVQ